MVASELADGKISVKISISEENKKKYPADHFLNLDPTALCELGWKPTTDLMDMYRRMVSAE